MLFQGIKNENGWVVLEYSATWNYGYDFMLDACQTVSDIDFKHNLQKVCITKNTGEQQYDCLAEVKAANGDLRACEFTAQENAVLSVAGYSEIMGCVLHICFYEHSNLVKVYSPSIQYFNMNGQHVLDNYMNSIEIKAYCMEAERNAMSKIGMVC